MYKDNTPSGVYRISLLNFLLILLIPVTLITSKALISMAYTPLLLSFGIIGILTLLCGHRSSKNNLRFIFTKPIILFGIWLIYVALNGIFLQGFHLFHYYLIFFCTLIYLLSALLSEDNTKINILNNSIIVTASVEALFCLTQYFRLFGSLNHYFNVTGSWENPNVTAMFLTMAGPAFYYWGCIEKKNQKYAIALFCITVIAISLLRCRTAMIGLALEVLIICSYRLSSKNLITKSWKSYVVIPMVIIVISATAGLAFYRSSLASANGRKFIWKLSLDMLTRPSILGSGYGNFERDYNLQQARYFAAGLGNATEIKNAGFVRMAYNELLQNGIEGGIIGLILFSGICLTVLFVPVFSKNTTLHSFGNGNTKQPPSEEHFFLCAYAGLVAFVGMSLFNFTLQAIPVMALFIVYSSFLSVHPSFTRYFSKPSTSIKWSFFRTSVIVAIGLGITFKAVSTTYYCFLNKEAKVYILNRNYTLGIKKLDLIGNSLSTVDDYWINYGDALLAQKQYGFALEKFDKAKSLTSDPALFIKIARCQAGLGNWIGAKSNLFIASNIEPNRIGPKYDLMQVFLSMNDTVNAVKMGLGIIATSPKVKSELAEKYKKSVQSVLSAFGPPGLQTSGVITSLPVNNAMSN